MANSFWQIKRIMPSFNLAYLLSLTVLVLFILWIFIDCSFRWVPWIIIRDFRLLFLDDPNLKEMHQWNIHGFRLLIFVVLALVGLTSTGIVFIRIIFGTETERSIKSMLFATALIAFWLSLFMSYDRLWWFAFKYRILRYHDAMKKSVAYLSDHWPTENVVLPGLGSYVVAKQEADLLYIDGSSSNGLTDFVESFDRIGKNNKGEYHFAVGSFPGWWIHFLKEGRTPKSHTRDVMGIEFTWEVQKYEELSENWYLVYYKIYNKDTPSMNNDQPQSPNVAPKPSD